MIIRLILIGVIFFLALLLYILTKRKCSEPFEHIKQQCRYYFPIGVNNEQMFEVHDEFSSIVSEDNIIILFDDSNNNLLHLQTRNIILSTKIKRNSFYVPNYIQYIMKNYKYNPYVFKNSIKSIKTKNICVVVPIKNDNSTTRRNQFELQCSLNNISFDKLEIELLHDNDVIKTFSEYSFVVIFENNSVLGHVTKSILLTLLANTVPIYWGAPDIDTHFNIKRIINITKYSSFSDCLHYVKSITHATYNNILSNSMYDTNSYFSILNGTNREYNAYINSKSLYKYPFIRYKPIHTKLIKSTSCFKIINLKIHTQRKRLIINQFNTLGLHYDIFEAIIGTLHMPFFIKNNMIVTHEFANGQRTMNYGELGIYLSKLELYNQLLMDHTHEYYIIFEDDVILDEQIINYENIVKNCPHDWDIIFLGVNKKFCNVGYPFYTKMTNICMPGAFAYIINKNACLFMLKYSLPIICAIDKLFQRYSEYNLNMYVYDIVNVDYRPPGGSSTWNKNAKLM